MRDLVVFAIFVFILPSCFLRPWVGVCAFTFLAYNRTQDLTWGFARGLPISQFIAIAMIFGWLFVELRPIPFNRKRVLAMTGLLLVVTGSMLVNKFSWSLQGNRYTDLVKVVVVSLVTGALLVNRDRLRQIIAVMSIGLGFYGLKNGLLFFLGSRSITGPGGMLKDNNDFALAMVMNMPLLYYLASDMKGLPYGKHIFRFMRAAAFLTPVTIISTSSRGAFLSLSVGALLVAWKTKWKVPAIATLFVLGLIGLAVAPQEYKDRISSIFKSAEEQDESVQGRFTSWKVAGNIIKAKPLTGIGFNRMVKEYNNYTKGIKNEQGTEEHFARVTHNSYLQIWAESGTIAYGLFMFMIVGSILAMEGTRRKAKRNGQEWAVRYADAIQVSMTSFMIGATFLNRAHFDFLYQLVIVGACLPKVMENDARRVEKEEVRTGPRIAQGVWVRHPNAFTKVGAPR